MPGQSHRFTPLLFVRVCAGVHDQAGAVQVCQIDPTRLGGVGEALSCAMLVRHTFF